MLPQNLLYRIAAHLREAWLARSRQPSQEETYLSRRLAGNFEALQGAHLRLGKAQRAGLLLVLPSLRAEVSALARSLHATVTCLHEHLASQHAVCPELAFLVAELRQIEEEFDGLSVRREQGLVAVTTEPITLEGVRLGRFALRFFGERLHHEHGAGCFEIVALDPNPSSIDAEVTHPHVKDGSLCAGDASAALNRALEQGRLFDGFCLVRSVLNHYNPGSAHVTLDRWHGAECYDCGGGMADGDSFLCEGCEHDLCESCIGSCSDCGRTRCPDCLDRCEDCAKNLCSGCAHASAGSDRTVCDGCLDADADPAPPSPSPNLETPDASAVAPSDAA